MCDIKWPGAKLMRHLMICENQSKSNPNYIMIELPVWKWSSFAREHPIYALVEPEDMHFQMALLYQCCCVSRRVNVLVMKWLFAPQDEMLIFCYFRLLSERTQISIFHILLLHGVVFSVSCCFCVLTFMIFNLERLNSHSHTYYTHLGGWKCFSPLFPPSIRWW